MGVIKIGKNKKIDFNSKNEDFQTSILNIK